MRSGRRRIGAKRETAIVSMLINIVRDATGAGTHDCVVPPALAAFAFNLQMVVLDFTAPGAITTSDALHVQVTR